jgi:hypothetical protein
MVAVMIFLSSIALLYLDRKYPDSHPLPVVLWFVAAVVTGAYEGVL